MQRTQDRRRNTARALTEAMERRILFAYPQVSPLVGPANPMNGVNIGQFSNPSFGDLDGDGDLDAVVGQSEFLRYFRNTGTVTAPIYTQVIGSQNPFAGLVFGNVASNPALGDVDGDGDLDLVLGSGAGTRYFRNWGSATFPIYEELIGTANPVNGVVVDGNSAPALGDLDGDGDLDILEGDLGGLMRYWRNNGTATSPNFQFTTSPLTGMDFGDRSTPTVGDMDGDGDLDVLIGDSTGSIRYFKNTGSADNLVLVQQTGSANPFNGVSVPGAAPAAGDLDGDGDLDVLSGSQAGTLHYWRNDIVAPAVNYLTNSPNPMNGVNIGQFSNPSFGDLDGDGDLDAVVGQSEFLRYFRNTGTVTAPIYTQVIGSQNPFAGLVFGNVASNPALGDVDGDGDLDLVLGSGAGTRYFRNWGSATFPIYEELTGTANPVNGVVVDGNSAPALGDLDGDGDLDILEGDLGGLMRYWRNNGTATSPNFQFTTSPLTGMDFGDRSTPTVGDMDGDGDLDVLIGDSTGSIRYFKNTGSANNLVLVQQTGSSNPFNGVSVPGAAPAAGDLDGDGDLDVLSGSQAGTLHYYRANRAAVVDNAIPDQTFTGPGGHSYVVPADTFIEPEGHALTYSATQASGAALPNWLSFNPATRTFSGNPGPGDASPLHVRVIVNDGNGGNGFDDFQLTLTSVADNSTHVTTLTDENNGNADPSHGAGTSLREAINYANTLATNPEITFEPALFSGGPATITLGGTALAISNTQEISGPGANLLTINANNLSRVFHVSGGGDVWMHRLTLAGGNADFGAGLLNAGSNLRLNGMVFNNNHASAFGGGLASPNGGNITILNSTFSNNTAGNEGAAIEAQGLLNAPSNVTLINSTISGNIANGSGFGAISNVASGGEANLIIQSSTIANNVGNSAGGVLNASNSGPAVTTYTNTIFDNGGPNIVNFGGTVTSLGYNLSTDNTGNLTADGDKPNTSAALGTLSNNGGETPTMALRPHSKAINAGIYLEGVFGDQRGVFRPQGSEWDIGAYEREATSAQLTSITFDFETQQALLFHFNADASVIFSRGNYTLVNLTTGQTMPQSLGTFGFNVQGRVATLALTNQLPDGDYRVTAGSTSLDFVVFAGDANRDRTVNISDFATLAARFNQNGTYSQGDFNYDGTTNISDFAILASKFNTSLPSAAAPLDPLAFASQGNLSVTSGTVLFNTDTLQVSGGGAGVTNVNGVLQVQQPGRPSIAVFAFSNVSIGAGATISVVGSNPIAILSHGNVNIAPAINLSGANGAAGSNAPTTPSANNGQDGVSNTSINSPGGAAPAAEFPGGKGGAGGVDNQTGQDGSPGFGGAPGGPGGPSSGQVLVVSSPGQPGIPGAHGINGAPGGGGTSAVFGGPSFFLASGSNGGAGQTGIAGKGGGGGGGGGGGSRGVFPITGNPDSGGGGGSGGNGGRGGGAGGAGIGGRAIEIGAVGFATLSAGIASNGGNGGNGGDRAIGSAGGTGGMGADSSGPGGNGGKGGNGGYGGPGGGGAGGVIFLHSAGTSIPTASVIGGSFATNNGNILSSPGQAGMLKLTNVTEFDVAGYTPGTYSALNVAGRFEIDGTVSFDFASNSIATSLTTSATLDTFFSLNGGPVAFAEFADVVFTGRSPTTTYIITLNSDRTFSVNPALAIGAGGTATAGSPRAAVARGSVFSTQLITRAFDRTEADTESILA